MTTYRSTAYDQPSAAPLPAAWLTPPPPASGQAAPDQRIVPPGYAPSFDQFPSLERPVAGSAGAPASPGSSGRHASRPAGSRPVPIGDVSTVEPPGPHVRLPLHAELYLLSHDPFTGAPLLHRATLGVGLAAASLLDLWFDGQIAFTASEALDATTAGAVVRLTLDETDRPAHPVQDAALKTIIAAGLGQSDPLRAFLHGAAEHLHTAVVDALLDARVLERTTVRRFGLFPTHTILATQPAWGVRAAARIREALTGHTDGDDGCAALGGLLACLDLTGILHTDIPEATLRAWLRQSAAERHPVLAQVLTALDAARGDLAVTALT
ncbi:GOLPH3/VPS74 family protein [Cryptosporangium minutisporangium]|uniref:GPP34 family phosphoprotein n=1 Tax=Cryptosporangium minutisporangium TaxID=113569 RepID=A0ABP6T0V9_9ACTN